jgi:hypothetical protein
MLMFAHGVLLLIMGAVVVAEALCTTTPRLP